MGLEMVLGTLTLFEWIALSLLLGLTGYGLWEGRSNAMATTGAWQGLDAAFAPKSLPETPTAAAWAMRWHNDPPEPLDTASFDMQGLRSTAADLVEQVKNAVQPIDMPVVACIDTGTSKAGGSPQNVQFYPRRGMGELAEPWPQLAVEGISAVHAPEIMILPSAQDDKGCVTEYTIQIAHLPAVGTLKS